MKIREWLELRDKHINEKGGIFDFSLCATEDLLKDIEEEKELFETKYSYSPVYEIDILGKLITFYKK